MDTSVEREAEKEDVMGEDASVPLSQETETDLMEEMEARDNVGSIPEFIAEASANDAPITKITTDPAAAPELQSEAEKQQGTDPLGVPETQSEAENQAPELQAKAGNQEIPEPQSIAGEPAPSPSGKTDKSLSIILTGEKGATSSVELVTVPQQGPSASGTHLVPARTAKVSQPRPNEFRLPELYKAAEDLANHGHLMKLAAQALQRESLAKEKLKQQVTVLDTNFKTLTVALKKSKDGAAHLKEKLDKEDIAKAKEILELSGNIEILKKENDDLRAENATNLQTAEANLQQIKDSAETEILKLKEELAAKDQELNALKLQRSNDEADINNFRLPLEAANAEDQAVSSGILGPVGLNEANNADSRLDRIKQASSLLQGLLHIGHELAAFLRMDKADNPFHLWEILKDAKEYVAQWKLSSARAGARMALTFAKGHHPELDLDEITAGFPEKDNEGKAIDKRSIWDSLAGYAERMAGQVNVKKFYDAVVLPSKEDPAESAQASSGSADEENDDASSNAEEEISSHSPVE